MIRMTQFAAKWVVVAAVAPVLVALVPGAVGMAGAQSAPEIDLECSCSYHIQGGTITFGAAAVTNDRTGGTSGTLKLKVWATSTPYRGGAIRGHLLATSRAAPSLLGLRPLRTTARAAPRER